jgi:hypothetical protein
VLKTDCLAAKHVWATVSRTLVPPQPLLVFRVMHEKAIVLSVLAVSTKSMQLLLGAENDHQENLRSDTFSAARAMHLDPRPFFFPLLHQQCSLFWVDGVRTIPFAVPRQQSCIVQSIETPGHIFPATLYKSGRTFENCFDPPQCCVPK